MELARGGRTISFTKSLLPENGVRSLIDQVISIMRTLSHSFELKAESHFELYLD